MSNRILGIKQPWCFNIENTVHLPEIQLKGGDAGLVK